MQAAHGTGRRNSVIDRIRTTEPGSVRTDETGNAHYCLPDEYALIITAAVLAAVLMVLMQQVQLMLQYP